MQIHNAVITGSFSYNGADLSTISSSNANSASVSSILTSVSSSNQQLSASYIALSASYNAASSSFSARTTQIEQVYATTGSNSFRATQSITGSLTVTGQITAQTLNVQQVTSSIVYSSGSNVFGCDINSRQTFTGSFYQTGSVAVFSNQVCSLMGNFSCVGIGFSSPNTSLVVSSSGANGINLGISTSSSTLSSRLFFQNSTTAFAVMNNADALSFFTGSVVGSNTGGEAMRITSGGLVAINQPTAYSAFNITGISCGWGEGIVMNPAPNGYSAINFRLEGRTGSCVTCTWQLGKEASGSNAGGEVFELNKEGLTGGAGYRVDAVQQWKTNGDSIFGFNVGIKCTTPSYALDVNGVIRASGTCGNNIIGTRIYASGTGTCTGFTLNSTLIYQGSGGEFNITNPGSYPNVAFTINTSGNIGLSVTPSSWGSGTTALQIGTTGTLWNRASDGLVVLASNSYYDGSVDKQITTNTSNRMYFVNGSTYFERAPSTSAGSNTPWNTSMTITNAGDVYIGGSTSLASGALIVGDNSSTRPIVSRTSGGVDGTYSLGMAFYPWNTSESNAILTTVSSAAGSSGFRFDVSNGGGTTGRTASLYVNRSSVSVVGSLSKGSGSFRICHPLSSKVKTHALVHSFIEGPNADLIYSGRTKLTNGIACVNVDCVSRMTEGTFEALNRCVRIFTTNESSWTAVRGKICGNIVIIESQDNTSEDEISWMVIGERQDEHMFETEWTDSEGRVITEPKILE